jgi:hypothetical protein
MLQFIASLNMQVAKKKQKKKKKEMASIEAALYLNVSSLCKYTLTLVAFLVQWPDTIFSHPR